MLILFFPKKAAQLKQSGMTLIIENNLSRSERLMRAAILEEIEQNKDYSKLSDLHKNYWLNRGNEYFDLTEDNFESVFLPDCAFIFDHLRDILGKSHQFERLVEIGTGSGDVLAYLNSKFNEIDQFYGIDLSETQIEGNKRRFTSPTINFVAADGFDWIAQNGVPHTIYVTSRGVLEYFTEEKLLQMFQMIQQKGEAIFVAIEPNGLDHDFKKYPHSQLYGNERSFSHNYPHLFKHAGFTIKHISEKTYPSHDHKLTFIIAQSA